MSKHFVRSIKNITNRYTSTEITVRNATSNEPWGPSISELHEIAVLTYHDKYVKEVLDVLEKRLNDKGKNWRHVMKALTILLHCIYEGSDTVIDWLKRNIYLVKTLRDFRYADERNIDQGAPIRAKASLITEMIESPEKLAQEKQQYKDLRANMARPGIVDLATGNAAPAKPRLTLDLSSSGRPRRSISTAVVAAATTANGSTSLPSQPSTSAGSPGSFTSPRTSLDAWAQQSSSGAYRNKARVAPKSSMEGRYSLSLPLHSITEESHYSAPTPRPQQPVSAGVAVPARVPLISNSNTPLSSTPPSTFITSSDAGVGAGVKTKSNGNSPATIRLVGSDNDEYGVGNSDMTSVRGVTAPSTGEAVRGAVSGSPTKINGNQGGAASAPIPATMRPAAVPVMGTITGISAQELGIPVTVLAPIVTSAVTLNGSQPMTGGVSSNSSISLGSPMSSNNPFFSMVAAQEQQQPR